MNSQRYVLKLDDNSYNDIKWSQLDKNIPIEFELENYFYSDGDMARIEWEVNNQVYLIQSGDEVSIEEDNKVKFKLRREIALTEGEGAFNVVITNQADDSRISTFRNLFRIEKGSVNEGQVSTSLIITAKEDLDKTITKFDTKVQAMNDKLENEKTKINTMIDNKIKEGNGTVDKINKAIADGQFDSFETKENHNKDMADRNIKTYNSLAQLGLTPSSATIADIASAMPNGSYLQLGIDSSFNTSQYPKNQGTLIIERANVNRIALRFRLNNGAEYVANYHSTNGLTTWKKIVNEDSIPQVQQDIVNLVYPVGMYVDFRVGVNPNTIYTWQKWEQDTSGTVLVGATGKTNDKEFGTVGNTGGNKVQKAELSNTAFAQIAIAEGSKRIQGKQVDTPNWNATISITGSSADSTARLTQAGINVAGTTNDFDNCMPYKVCSRWYRVS